MFDSMIEISDIFPYLCGLLGLLLLWQYHEKQVLAGRIQAIDIFDRSGMRMYICATPDDEETCEACREVNGLVLLPSQVARKDFSPLQKPCAKAGKCIVVLAGLYGAWLEARSVVGRLRATVRTGPLKLSDPEISALLNGKWESCVSAATDRCSVQMLTALSFEQSFPDSAIAGYRHVIEHAKEVHDLPLVVPAYLRLTELLSREGRINEAIELIEEFDNRFQRNKTGPYYPKEKQRGLMSIKKTRLKTAPPPPKPQPAQAKT